MTAIILFADSELVNFSMQFKISSMLNSKTIRGRFIVFLSLLWPCICFAWADTWDGIADAAKGIEAIRADFVQEKHLPILVRPLVSRGRLCYRKPDALRWEYTSPVKSVLIAKDGEVRRFIQTGERMVEDHGIHLTAMQSVMPEIGGMLGGRFQDSPMFTASIRGEHEIVLIPKDDGMKRLIQRIELTLADTPGVIEQVLIFESEDAYTKMIFTKTRINPDLNPHLFEEAQ